MADTSNLLDFPCPPVDLSTADPKFSLFYTQLTDLLHALAAHPATPRSNLPIAEIKACKKRPYFLWDFVGRTRVHLAMLDPSLPGSDQGAFADVVGRSAMAKMLCTKDDNRTYLMCGGDRTDMTPEVKQAAEKLCQGL